MKIVFTALFLSFFYLNTSAQLPQQNLAAPFYHGVASGDPLIDAVIIWTRVAPINQTENKVEGKWLVAMDAAMKNQVQIGVFETDDSKDYTVKIDVTNLKSNTYYYYQFEAFGKKSIIGRTKTAPKKAESDALNFAVVSCNNFQDGYFNGYRVISKRNDLDAVIHLGDYIYEYGEGGYNRKNLARNLSPTTEILDLADYRMRYSQYRLDIDFIKVHQQHPFICIWDDHETANDSYKDGAQNHNPKYEGDWETRKKLAKQAYFEWLPIRNHPEQKINRILKYGDLADLIMLDTRLEARDKKPQDMFAADYMDSTRVILGKEQREWLFDALKNSTAEWKIIGQQVIFSELNVGWVDFRDRQRSENYFLDIWDGYPVERTKVIDFLKESRIENTVLLTGDFHSSFAYEVADNPTNSENYNPENSKGAVAVEFVTPSITSSNFDEILSKYRSRKIEQCLDEPCPMFPFFYKKNPNPHLKYVDLRKHGFIILNVTKAQTQASFYYLETIDKRSDDYYFETALATKSGQNHLQVVAEIIPKSLAEAAKNIENTTGKRTIISGIYQKENATYVQLYTAFPNVEYDFCLSLLNEQKELIKTFPCKFKGRTVYTVHFSSTALPKGKYYLRLENDTILEEDLYYFEN
jgi:alkaline phosphatase D